MKAFGRACAALLVCASLLPGCAGGQGISPADPTRGALRAARLGRTVLVEVGLENLPEKLEVLTLGLKLQDGTAVYPRTIRWLPGPTGDLDGCPRVDFAFSDGQAERRVEASPQTWLGVTFELENGWSDVDEGTFTVVLGDPEMLEGCRMGITTTLAARDGSPSLFACIYLPKGDAAQPFQLPLPPLRYVPAVAFHFEEQPPLGGRARVSILAAVTRSGLLPVRGGLAMASTR